MQSLVVQHCLVQAAAPGAGCIGGPRALRGLSELPSISPWQQLYAYRLQRLQSPASLDHRVVAVNCLGLRSKSNLSGYESVV